MLNSGSSNFRCFHETSRELGNWWQIRTALSWCTEVPQCLAWGMSVLGSCHICDIFPYRAVPTQLSAWAEFLGWKLHVNKGVRILLMSLPKYGNACIWDITWGWENSKTNYSSGLPFFYMTFHWTEPQLLIHPLPCAVNQQHSGPDW